MLNNSIANESSKLKQKKFKFGLMSFIQRLLSSECEKKYSQTFYRCNQMSLGQGTIRLMRNSNNQTACFDNIQTCGNVWLCPVCSTKIARERHNEVEKAVKGFHLTSQNTTCMLTLTFSHSKKDSLSSLLKLHSQASANFWSCTAVKKIFKQLGYVGRISNFEITCSELNGWHPHKHILLFLENANQETLHKASSQLLDLWLIALHKAGLSGNEHALRLDYFRGTTDYLTKLANEMTLSHVKHGRGVFSHYSPFQLAELAKNKVSWARGRFIEYATCIKGRSQLHWSRGLKARFNIGVQSDSDIASNVSSDYKLVFEVVAKDFKNLYRNAKTDFRPLLLTALGKGDLDSVYKILEVCKVRIAPNQNPNPWIYWDDYYKVVPEDKPYYDYEAYNKSKQYVYNSISANNWRELFSSLGEDASWLRPDYYQNCLSW